MKYMIGLLVFSFIFVLYLFVCISIKMVLQPEESFIVYLTNTQSYVSPIQEDNQPSDFYSVLPEKMVLTGDWEVGLLELSFRKDWTNIEEEQKIEMTCDRHMDFPPLMYLEPNNYNKVEDIINDLNKIIKSNDNSYHFLRKPEFSIDRTTRKVQVKSGKCSVGKSIRFPDSEEHECFPILSEYLNKILGFTDTDGSTFSYSNYDNFAHDEDLLNLQEPSHNVWFLNVLNIPYAEVGARYLIAQEEPNLHIVKYMDIHTNIVKPSINGNVFETILAKVSVPQNKTFKEDIVISVDYPVYREISHREITEILIQIFDDKGRLINFDRENKISAVLEFKKKNAFRKSLHKLLHQSGR